MDALDLSLEFCKQRQARSGREAKRPGARSCGFVAGGARPVFHWISAPQVDVWNRCGERRRIVAAGGAE